MKFSFVLPLFLFLLLITGCSNNLIEEKNDSVIQQATPPDSESGPVTASGGYVQIAFSEDGLNWGDPSVFSPNAGVPNLLMTSDGILITTFQYFDTEDIELFNVIVYQISNDQGQTWEAKHPIIYESLPELYKNKIGVHVEDTVDPTLVQLEDGRLRLYFTYQTVDDDYPSMHSAIADTIEGPFVYEDGTRLFQEGDILLDPAVVYFQGAWHHYTWLMANPNLTSYPNVHSTSNDGLLFERQADIDLPMNMLGQALVVGEELWFYGTGMQSKLAISADGYNFSSIETTGIYGNDGGVVQLLDSTFMMLYTTGKEFPQPENNVINK